MGDACMPNQTNLNKQKSDLALRTLLKSGGKYIWRSHSRAICNTGDANAKSDLASRTKKK